MYGQKNDLRRGTGFPQSIGCVYPVEFRHRNVSDDDIRLQFTGSFDQRFTILRTPDDAEGWFQESSDYLRQAPMVIGRKYVHISQIFSPPRDLRELRPEKTWHAYGNPPLPRKAGVKSSFPAPNYHVSKVDLAPVCFTSRKEVSFSLTVRTES